MRMLFVEDDPMNRKVVREMLTPAKVSLDEAPDGPTGLEMVDTNAYDLVLMDLRMPGMDGVECIQHIRARGDAKGQVPIIVVTADTAMDLRSHCIENGADEFILKPVELRALFEAIGVTLAKRRQAAAKAQAQTSAA